MRLRRSASTTVVKLRTSPLQTLRAGAPQKAATQRMRSAVDATLMHGHVHAAVIGLALIAHAQ